jgi:hypothetical protein
MYSAVGGLNDLNKNTPCMKKYSLNVSIDVELIPNTLHAAEFVKEIVASPPSKSFVWSVMLQIICILSTGFGY